MSTIGYIIGTRSRLTLRCWKDTVSSMRTWRRRCGRQWCSDSKPSGDAFAREALSQSPRDGHVRCDHAARGIVRIERRPIVLEERRPSALERQVERNGGPEHVPVAGADATCQGPL